MVCRITDPGQTRKATGIGISKHKKTGHQAKRITYLYKHNEVASDPV